MTGPARPRRPAGDAGLSLVELSVAMLVTAVLTAAVATVFIGTTQATRTMNVRTATSADLRPATEAFSRTARVAYQPVGESSAVASATSSAVSFYALLNRTGATSQPLPTLVEYAYNGTCLTEAQTPARTLSVPASDGSIYEWDTGRVSKCILRTSVAPTFSYFTTGAIVSSGTTVAALTVPTAGLDLVNRQSVRSIEVSLTARDAVNPSVGGVSSVIRVSLQNVISAAGGV